MLCTYAIPLQRMYLLSKACRSCCICSMHGHDAVIHLLPRLQLAHELMLYTRKHWQREIAGIRVSGTAIYGV